MMAESPIIRVDGRLLLAGDGIKISKEAEKMPGVKKLHQDSDNSGKAQYIYGHHHGVIGILAGWVKKKSFVFPCMRSSMRGLRSLEIENSKKNPNRN